MKTLYISDLDGTLLNSKKEVTEYTAGIINRCIESGTLFSVATARMPYGCDYRLKQLKLQAPAILTNGVFIYDFNTGRYLHAEKMEKKTAWDVIAAFEENGKSCFMYLFQDGQISLCYGDDSLKSQEQYYSKRALESCRRVYRSEDFRKETGQGDVVYFALTGTGQELAPVCKSLDAVQGVRYACYLNIYNGLYCLEVFSKMASKRHALLRLKDMLECDELVVFGDNHNDMPMIEIADRSYAPANALEVVKQAVTDILEDCDHDGVAKFLKREIGI